MPSRYLVLLDMNGSLCYRTEEAVRGAREDLYVRRKYYYARRGIDKFVRALGTSGKFEICVYTSMMGHNAEAGLNAVLREREHISHVLDRKMNKPDPDGVNDWDTVRDMDKVWSRLTGYGPERTLLVDNEERKFKDTPLNGIIVPEFGPREILSRDSSTLDALLTYMLQLGEDAPEDVRVYMRARPPFDVASSGKELTAPSTATDVLASTLATALSLNETEVDPTKIPPGMRFHLVCIENGQFVMSGGKDDVRASRPPTRRLSRLKILLTLVTHLPLRTAPRWTVLSATLLAVPPRAGSLHCTRTGARAGAHRAKNGFRSAAGARGRAQGQGRSHSCAACRWTNFVVLVQ